MSDLVKRLRCPPSIAELHFGLTKPAIIVWHRTACEGADEIERLRASNTRLHINGTKDGLEIEQLTAALKPFAKAHDALHSSEDFNPYKYITMHHLRMAHKALAAVDKPHKKWDVCVNCGQALGGPITCCDNPHSATADKGDT